MESDAKQSSAASTVAAAIAPAKPGATVTASAVSGQATAHVAVSDDATTRGSAEAGWVNRTPPARYKRRLLALGLLTLVSSILFVSAAVTSSWVRYSDTVASVTTTYRSGLFLECSYSSSTLAGVRAFPELCRYLPFYCEPGNSTCAEFRVVQAFAILCALFSLATAWSMCVVSTRIDMCAVFQASLYSLGLLTAVFGFVATLIYVDRFHTVSDRVWGSSFIMFTTAWVLIAVTTTLFGWTWYSAAASANGLPGSIEAGAGTGTSAADDSTGGGVAMAVVSHTSSPAAAAIAVAHLKSAGATRVATASPTPPLSMATSPDPILSSSSFDSDAPIRAPVPTRSTRSVVIHVPTSDDSSTATTTTSLR